MDNSININEDDYMTLKKKGINRSNFFRQAIAAYKNKKFEIDRKLNGYSTKNKKKITTLSINEDDKNFLIENGLGKTEFMRQAISAFVNKKFKYDYLDQK